MSFRNLTKTSIHYDDAAVQNMISLVKLAPFPTQAPIDPQSPWSLGIDYEYLRNLKAQFENEWQWSRVENQLNQFDNYLVNYTSPSNDELQLHFIHQRSKRADAIPLILLHGWPGIVSVVSIPVTH
jgi:hypothetical protein